MKICIGILAYNEERGIAATLADLLEQDLWGMPGMETRLHVVVNGSRDQTAAVARQALAASPSAACCEVHDLEQAGKANAWNRFVHAFSPADTDIFLLADADIRLPQIQALRSMVETLLAHAEAAACVDEPRKDFERVRMHPLMRRLSAAASAAALRGPPKLCGQLYAARAEALRRIFLPEPLLVEDGFIKAMLVTDGFSGPEQSGRLVRAPGIHHLYEPERSRKAVFLHEKRILIGSLCNFRLFDLVRPVAGRGEPVGAWLRARTEQNPEWFRTFLQEQFQKGSPHVRQVWTMVFAPLRSLKHGGLTSLPIALIRVAASIPVGLAARRDLKSGTLTW